jgi:hypothetical protein
VINCLSCYLISLIRIIPKTIEDLIKDVIDNRRAFLPELKYHGSCRAYRKNNQHFVNRPIYTLEIEEVFCNYHLQQYPQPRHTQPIHYRHP